MGENSHKQNQSGFGKRGRIVTKPPEEPSSSSGTTERPTWLKWAIGAVAAVFLLAMLPFGAGGGGLLGGILGGLIAGKLLGKAVSSQPSAKPAMDRAGGTAAASPSSASSSASSQSTVARGGFGATGAASGASSSFGG